MGVRDLLPEGEAMKEIKFRLPLFTEDGDFTRFIYLDLSNFDSKNKELPLWENSYKEKQQYIGLPDKNSKEACTGDILETPIGRATIEFGQYGNAGDREAYHMGFYIKFEREDAEYYRKEIGYWLPKSEIVGNIYESEVTNETT